MEVIKTLPETISCYLLKPVALHFHVNDTAKKLMCEVICRFASRDVTLKLPPMEITPNKRNVIRLGGIQTLPEDIKDFTVYLKIFDENNVGVKMKTKVRVARNINMQAYINLNKPGTQAHYLTIPEHNWDITQ